MIQHPINCRQYLIHLIIVFQLGLFLHDFHVLIKLLIIIMYSIIPTHQQQTIVPLQKVLLYIFYGIFEVIPSLDSTYAISHNIGVEDQLGLLWRWAFHYLINCRRIPYYHAIEDGMRLQDLSQIFKGLPGCFLVFRYLLIQIWNLLLQKFQIHFFTKSWHFGTLPSFLFHLSLVIVRVQQSTQFILLVEVGTTLNFQILLKVIIKQFVTLHTQQRSYFLYICIFDISFNF